MENERLINQFATMIRHMEKDLDENELTFKAKVELRDWILNGVKEELNTILGIIEL